ncbi:MAG: ABC-F family ATP-binding cassette domain-containing protein [Bifidobacteriaceae bacterium]|jgi:ATPase subunit of ABC transporter with duplicated ATPase domains|nr:ABC-F family ATP-binding cassette domain-containing protein [Bifidobacteriaceae bacterium]
MTHLIGAEAVALAYPNRRVFERVSLGISTGDMIGVVGRNGDGKTTLIRLLAGAITPDSGRVTRRGGTDVAYLPQADVLDSDATVGDAIVGKTPEHEWAGNPKVRDVIGGLVGDLAWGARIGTLSGGQRRRVALAAVLAGEHDVLLLDEPTNHLDLEAITWLAEHLRGRWPSGQGALVAVTHDRWFLDAVCNSTWEVGRGGVEPFEGGYAAYILGRVERDRQAAASEARRRNVLRKELAWLRRGAPARTSKPKFRLDAAAQLIESEPPPRDQLELVRLATARLGKDVIDVIDVSAGYHDGPDVLAGVTWLIGPGERAGILGANGAGKSTLLALVTGALAPRSGRVKRGKTVRIATLAQDLGELAAVEDRRIADLLADLKRDYAAGGSLGWTGGGRDAANASTPGAAQFTPSQLLERLGFSPAHLATPVRDLSGGQRRRLQLALVLLSEPNVLILDEPSNDLDTDMLAAMEDLLDSWPGTLLVVTHDRYLMERVTDSQFALLDGRLRHVPGGVAEYLRIRGLGGGGQIPADDAGARPGADASVGAGPGGRGADGRGADGRGAAGAELRAARKEIAAIERRLGKLRAQVADVHAQLAGHDQSDYVGIGRLARRAEDFQAEVALAEDRWLELADRIE